MLIIVLWILLQTSFFQNFLIHKVTQRLSKDLNTTVSIKHIDLQLFDKMLLEGTLVLDRKKDTLLYAGKVKVNITDWFFFKNDIVLNYIGLDDAIINLNRTDSIWNYQFLMDYFSSPKQKDTSSHLNLDLKVADFNRVKIWQQDAWDGHNMLVSLQKMHLQANELNIQKKSIQIENILFEKPIFAQYDYTGKHSDTKPLNENVGSKKLIKNDSIITPSTLQWNTEDWNIFVKNITLKDGGIAIIHEEAPPSIPNTFDESRIILSELNGQFKNTRFIKDTLQSQVNLSLKDRGGFVIKQLKADYKFTPKIMEFKNLDLVTSHSHLKDYYAMHYHSFGEDMGNFIQDIVLEGNFIDSKLSSDDLAYFSPDTKSWHSIFSVNGKVKGSVDNLVAKDIKISDGKQNYLEGSVSLRGLPNIEETFIDFNSKKLSTSYYELVKLIPEIKKITNPNLSALGKINFVGNYTGFIRDFVTYGQLTSDIGTLQTDLHLKIPIKGKAIYQGKITTKNFQLGKFIGSSQLGNISFDGKIDGQGFSENDILINIDGAIHLLAFNGYNYSNIIAHGQIDQKLFTGSASIHDENIEIDTLVGSINFSKSKPAFALEANINHVNFKKIGITNDTISLKGKVVLNFTGSNIDNFLGTAQLFDAELIDNGQRLSFDSLIILSAIENESKLLSIHSNEVSASILGNFKILDLPNSFQLFLNKYYPAYISKPNTIPANQDFSFKIETRSVSDYLNLFNKKMSGLDNSVIAGNINLGKNTLSIEADVPLFSYDKISFNTIHISGIGTGDTLLVNGDIGDVVINDSLHSPETKIKITAANDISDIWINATANQTLSAADISARIETKKNGVKLTFNPSTFTLNNKVWNIQEKGEIEIHEKMIMASNILISQNGQEISLSTTPSEIGTSNDVIVQVKNLIIEDFTPLFITSPSLKGQLNGFVRINDPFGKMTIDFNNRINAFQFENDSIGVINANGNYVVKTNEFSVKATSENELYHFKAGLDYNPLDSLSPIRGSISVVNSNIHILEEYLSGILSNINGRATGVLNFSGTSSHPKIIGDVRLDSTSMIVNYTRCNYHLENGSIIQFKDDEIDFGKITIRDSLNQTATLSGIINHNFFDNFYFDNLSLKTDVASNGISKFLLLNTTSRDNNQFYGNVIGKATLSINGPATDMRINISGEPTDSSHIYLPVGETAETGSLDYIEFIKFGKEMKADLKVRENTNIKVEINLIANPLAKIDVILDETTGDVIKAQGRGKLQINVGTKDPLTIRGRYDVEQGQYTFNFQTFLKTPFTLQQGYIEWQGDPYLANLNIDAIYRAENVVLSNIPTSRGIANTRGDVDILFKLRGTLKNPQPFFEFQFPFDNPLKSDPIANEYLKTRYQSDNNQLINQVASLLLFNTFMNNDQGLLSSNNTGYLVTKSVGDLLSTTLSNSLNNWVQKLLNTKGITVYANINTADFNFQKSGTQKEIQNLGNFGLKTSFLNGKLLVRVGGMVDYRKEQATTNTNSNFLLTPDVSFEYLITPDGRFRVIGFNRSDTDAGDIAGVTRRNRTGIQFSYRKSFNSFEEFFTGSKNKTKDK
jgi:hypothetical protein